MLTASLASRVVGVLVLMSPTSKIVHIFVLVSLAPRILSIHRLSFSVIPSIQLESEPKMLPFGNGV